MKSKTYKLVIVIPSDADDAHYDAVDNDVMKKIHHDIAAAGMRVNDLTRDSSYQRQMLDDEGNNVWVEESAIAPDALTDELPRQITWTYTATCEEVTSVAVLADSAEEALKHAQTVWPSSQASVIAIADRVALARLYGHRAVPFAVAPGTQELLWHREITVHERAGRIVQI